MENDNERWTESLRAAERAEIAPWTDYPPTPAWFPPAVGAWAAAFVVTTSALGDHHLLQMLGYLVLVGAVALFVTWYRRYRGTMPDLGSVPPEFRRSLVLYVVGVLLGVVVVAGVTGWLGAWSGAFAALAVFTAGIALHERAYAAAARRTKQNHS